MGTLSFDKDFLEKQKAKLLAEKERLIGELEKRGKAKKNDPCDYQASFQDFGADEESQAAEYAQAETDNSVVEELDDELKRVNDALERIAQGTYGLDSNTGEPIKQERLEAYPAAETNI